MSHAYFSFWHRFLRLFQLLDFLASTMVVARTVKYYFKEGKREEGFEKVDLAVNKKARKAKGFRGLHLPFFIR